MLDVVRELITGKGRAADLEAKLAELRDQTPVPVFWLFGKTQSGKTSLIQFLTGADEAEIGQGFQPCTRTSRIYQFPSTDVPLLQFLDTRGVDEPGYDPSEDIARFHDQAHVVIVTAKALDHGQATVLEALRRIRQDKPTRPVLLALTCLHEAYPGRQHPQPYPFTTTLAPDAYPYPDLPRSLAEQQRRFDGLIDRVVPLDLTRPVEGFDDPVYGGEHLKADLIALLPQAYRQTMLSLQIATRELQDLHMRRAFPVLVGYSALAASVGAIPVPFVDLVLLPGIQTRMVQHLAVMYGQPLTAKRFLEMASTLGIGLVARQAAREVAKFIPFVGSVAGAALAGASTFALGKAFCYYYGAILEGHVPDARDLRRYYDEQLHRAEAEWKQRAEPKGSS